MVARQARLLQLGFKYPTRRGALGLRRNELAKEIEADHGKPVFRHSKAQHYLFYFCHHGADVGRFSFGMSKCRSRQFLKVRDQSRLRCLVENPSTSLAQYWLASLIVAMSGRSFRIDCRCMAGETKA